MNNSLTSKYEHRSNCAIQASPRNLANNGIRKTTAAVHTSILNPTLTSTLKMYLGCRWNSNTMDTYVMHQDVTAQSMSIWSWSHYGLRAQSCVSHLHLVLSQNFKTLMAAQNARRSMVSWSLQFLLLMRRMNQIHKSGMEIAMWWRMGPAGNHHLLTSPFYEGKKNKIQHEKHVVNMEEASVSARLSCVRGIRSIQQLESYLFFTKENILAA